MKHLGIDFGTKRIGLAVSDLKGSIAFPKKIITNSRNVVDDILDIVEHEGIQSIVVGKSLDPWGSENLVQKEIDFFVKKLSHGLEEGIEIIQQDERGSSVAARSHLYGKGNIANKRWTSTENNRKRQAVDAGAAAIILQRYLDKK